MSIIASSTSTSQHSTAPALPGFVTSTLLVKSTVSPSPLVIASMISFLRAFISIACRDRFKVANINFSSDCLIDIRWCCRLDPVSVPGSCLNSRLSKDIPLRPTHLLWTGMLKITHSLLSCQQLKERQRLSLSLQLGYFESKRTLAMPSKALFKWGCTSVGSFESE